MLMVVTRHEGGDLSFEIAGQVVVLKQDAVLERLMPALDLALGLRVIRGGRGHAPSPCGPSLRSETILCSCPRATASRNSLMSR
jgi:hypothetical protein